MSLDWNGSRRSTNFEALCLIAFGLTLAACGGGGGGGSDPPPPLPAGTVAFSSPTYSTAQNTGLMTIAVERNAGTRDGSVSYATADQSAVAGTDYTARTGTVTWASGDGSPKTISLPVNSATPNSSDKTFTVTLSSPTNGLSLGSMTTATITITAAPSTAKPAVSVRGNRLVDADGNVLQLRGVSFSGFVYVAIGGFNPADPSGGQAGQPNGPRWSAVRAWKANTVRITLNESSWLGLTCVDTDGVSRKADPGGNYQTAVKTQVDQAVAAGLYVILALHWAAPGTACPMVQTQMANADHSVAFWTSVANMFKNNSSVMFSLFNEPFFYGLNAPTDEWAALMNGATFNYFPATSGTHNYKNINGIWTSIGMQALLDAIRATGATNVVFIGGTEFGNNMSKWGDHLPRDPLNQVAAEWHPYPPIQGAQSVTISAGGSGHVVGDVITLAKPNTVYTPATITVTSVGAGGAITSVTLKNGGRYLQSALPTAPIGQASTTGVGTGASFTLGQFGNLSSPWSMPSNWPAVQALSVKVPVVLSETGEHNAPGTVGAPFLQQLLPFAGANNFSVIGCCWDLVADQDNVLIKDVNGAPTDGYGKVFYDWMTGAAWQ